MRLRNLAVVLVAVLMVAVLAACGGGETSSADQEKTKQQTTPQEQVAPNQGNEKTTEEQAQAPEDKSLKLTVPKMERINNSEIPTGEGSATQMFKENAAVRLSGTGYPWEEEANVYIAGHAMGYPRTPSWQAFTDLDTLENGDEIFLQDANGERYTYEVFEKVIVQPTELWVLDPVQGKNIVSLQTCTLPDYSDRLIVRGQLKT
jgi:sortase A